MAANDKFAQVRGFTVEISGADGQSTDVDTDWDTFFGGELIFTVTDPATGDKFQTTSPGHKSVNEITLRGAMTDKRAALCTWINETVQGKDSRRTVTIKEIVRDGSTGEAARTYVYRDCFPCGYVFPRLSVTNTGSVMEEVRLKPIRLELK